MTNEGRSKILFSDNCTSLSTISIHEMKRREISIETTFFAMTNSFFIRFGLVEEVLINIKLSFRFDTT